MFYNKLFPSCDDFMFLYSSAFSGKPFVSSYPIRRTELPDSELRVPLLKVPSTLSQSFCISQTPGYPAVSLPPCSDV